jgi:hypothetical protein
MGKLRGRSLDHHLQEANLEGLRNRKVEAGHVVILVAQPIQGLKNQIVGNRRIAYLPEETLDEDLFVGARENLGLQREVEGPPIALEGLRS